MKRCWEALKTFLGKFDMRDLHAYGGTALLAAGLAWAGWLPAILIVPGLVFLYIALRRVK